MPLYIQSIAEKPSEGIKDCKKYLSGAEQSSGTVQDGIINLNLSRTIW